MSSGTGFALVPADGRRWPYDQPSSGSHLYARLESCVEEMHFVQRACCSNEDACLWCDVGSAGIALKPGAGFFFSNSNFHPDFLSDLKPLQPK